MKNIYISTIALSQYGIEEILNICIENKFRVEFSSGLPYSDKLKSLFLDYPFDKLAHNYFPAPELPFVLNLASINDEIRNQSIEHCLQGLRLTKAADAPFFAAHAGFCIDPRPEDLGKKLSEKTAFEYNRAEHWNLFCASVRQILRVANKLEVNFYIENNVIAPFNIDSKGQNPLLCCDAIELNQLMTEINDERLGILLDTAHFKVSSETLNFDLIKNTNALKSVIKALHHSDNNGKSDSNSPLNEDYWFIPFLSEFRHLPQVIEVKQQSVEQLKRQLSIL
jgi:sugar phosphate isomerase/epimerase